MPCCRRYGKLGHAVHPLGFFLIPILTEIKVLDFPSNLTVQTGRIKQGNAANTAFTCRQVLPKFVFTDTNRGNGTDACYDDSSFQRDHLLVRFA